MTLVLLIVAALTLAYANGANDNFKATATIYGSGALDYRSARRLATLAQLTGSLASVMLAGALLESFGGKGLVPPEVVADERFLVAVSVGAASTVLMATRVGLPISTTHALVGGLAGAGLAFSPSQLSWSALGGSYFLPLLVSPLLSTALAVVFHPLARLQRTSTRSITDRLHFGSAFALGFARGLNDTPKVLALLVAAGWSGVDARLSLAVVAGSMALGGWLHARRVAETLAHGITSLSHDQGLLANGIVSTLVIGATLLGAPVSTTHVSTGSLVGIGVWNEATEWAMVGGILLAWIATLPMAAAHRRRHGACAGRMRRLRDLRSDAFSRDPGLRSRRQWGDHPDYGRAPASGSRPGALPARPWSCRVFS